MNDVGEILGHGLTLAERERLAIKKARNTGRSTMVLFTLFIPIMIWYNLNVRKTFGKGLTGFERIASILAPFVILIASVVNIEIVAK